MHILFIILGFGKPESSHRVYLWSCAVVVASRWVPARWAQYSPHQKLVPTILSQATKVAIRTEGHPLGANPPRMPMEGKLRAQWIGSYAVPNSAFTPLGHPRLMVLYRHLWVFTSFLRLTGWGIMEHFRVSPSSVVASKNFHCQNQVHPE